MNYTDELFGCEEKNGVSAEVSLDSLNGRIENLNGLDDVKQELRSLIGILNVQSLRCKMGIHSSECSLHYIFKGCTDEDGATVAKILADAFCYFGFAKQGKVTEVNSKDLYSEKVGESWRKTVDVISSSVGGVLLIKEPYLLSKLENGDEVLNAVIKEMEDHRGELYVILSGDGERMEDFLNANSIYYCRIPGTINFEY